MKIKQKKSNLQKERVTCQENFGFHTTSIRKINKKAVSLMLSYVLLISIVLVLSISVFSWLKLTANVQPEVDCKADTSIIIQNYRCDPSSAISNFELILKNNGRFNIEGVIVTVGNDPDKIPITYLIPNTEIAGTLRGHYYFPYPLKPGNKITINFLNKINKTSQVDFETINVTEIQPFILYNDDRIICQNAVKRIPIEDCQIIIISQ